MPQLDILTFNSQVFWLVVIFFGLYLSVVRHMLPNLATILKVRSKTLAANSQQVNSLESEENAVISNFDNSVKNTLVASRKILSDTAQHSTEWFNTSLKEVNEKTLLKVNQEYIKTLYEISAKKYLVIKTVNESY